MDQDDSNMSYPSRKRKEVNYSEEPPEFAEIDLDAAESVASEPAKPRKIKFVMSSENLFEDYAQIIKGIRTLKDDFGRAIYKLFAEKPSRQLFHAYYQVIAKPI